MEVDAPSVVSAMKSGATSPIFSPIAQLLLVIAADLYVLLNYSAQSAVDLEIQKIALR